MLEQQLRSVESSAQAHANSVWCEEHTTTRVQPLQPEPHPLSVVVLVRKGTETSAV